ncbi:MAG: 3-hydroxy-3-methylglutaryl CoA synthase, partial [candidate division NC10 bacterium]
MALGIVSAAAYIPRYRLGGKTLQAVWGSGGSGERAVANYDEDSLTMAVEASLDALAGRDASTVGACFLASTTAPYLEKSSATLLATATDLGPEVLTADLGGSLRCGTTALRLALDMVRAGSVSQALVAASDMRPVAPGSPEEVLLGDGAAAFLVG